MRIFFKLALSEWRLSLREPVTAFFGLVFPTMLVVILGIVPAFREPDPALGGVRVVDLYVPIVLAMVLAMLAFQSMPQTLATYREKGVLRRFATTPARPVALLGAQVAVMLTTAILSAGLVLSVARYAFGVAYPRHFFLFALSFLLCATAVLAIGVFVAAVVPSAKAASGIGAALFFPLMFLAGLWVPRELMPEFLRHIGNLTPLGAGQSAMQASTTGHWPSLLSVLVVLTYLAVFGWGAARYFKWQ